MQSFDTTYFPGMLIRTRVVWKFFYIVLLLLGLSVLSPDANAATFNVSVLDDEFEPKNLTIAPGDTVVWRNLGGGAHSVVADNGAFASTNTSAAIPFNQTFTHTFNTEGRFAYYCLLHGGPGGQDMSGVIRVVDPSLNNPPATPTNLMPIAGATNQSISPTLKSSAFSDDPGDIHIASRWIIRDVVADTVVLDTGETEDHKTSLLIDLSPSTLYAWKVQYKDDRGALSEFSAETQFTTIAEQTNAGAGLTATYAKYTVKTGAIKEVLTQVDPVINFDWKLGKPNRSTPSNNFFVRWEGTVLPQFSESYRFRVVADGGVRLWVNGVLIIDDWVDAPFALFRNNVITLQAGVPVTIKLEYYDRLSRASVSLRWSSMSLETEVIPQARLFPLPL